MARSLLKTVIVLPQQISFRTGQYSRSCRITKRDSDALVSDVWGGWFLRILLYSLTAL